MDITQLKGVGDSLAAKLEILGIKTVDDLLQHFPRRYEDYSNITPIKDVKPGTVTLQGAISNVVGRYVRRGMHITEAILSDDTGSVRLVWFNQSYRAGSIKPSQQYFVAGEYSLGRGRFSITNPAIELVSDFPVNAARIIPIYKETKGLKSLQLRKLLRQVLSDTPDLSETLPSWLIEKYKLEPHTEALHHIHFPDSAEEVESARRRFGFEEIFSLTLAALLNKRDFSTGKALSIPFNQKLAQSFVAHLPFKLTDAQRKVIWRIYQDMERTEPMNCLVEGDVGAGKTVVATMAALMAMEQGYQVALMAPTELLARQHAETIHTLLQKVGFADQVGLLIGSLSAAQKTAAHTAIAEGKIRFIIGTHALIQDSVDMHKLGLIVIDEQHRFGVEQRKKLQAKAGHMPHVLHMTATPIPRSLALTLYGELDISILDNMPDTRAKVHTELCSPNSRTQLYKKIDAKLGKGEQLFVVCPLITQNDASESTSAEQMYETLAKSVFKHRRVGLLHGKLKSAEKEAVMNQFVKREIDILVSTTVIEVGVHVPNATMILIESAERFGLAQIHQLRGRVGRGGVEGHCYLMLSDSKQPTPRLRALETMNDGFALADLDLQLRGPGAIYGVSQHGLLDLRVANLSDVKLIAAAREAAATFIERDENLLHYKQLAARVNRLRAVVNLN